MSISGYHGYLNPTAPEFLPRNLLPITFFVPTRFYLPPPPPPPFYPNFTGALPLPLTSMTPTRAVMLLSAPNDVTESSIRRDLEVFGDVRGVQMERADEGIVTVHFYNLKDSQRALKEIRNRHMQQHFSGCYTAARGLISGRLVWAQFVFPQLNAVPQGNNQGSLVIMNLEPTVSSTTLRQIFQVYGEVKELRETPYKRQQRFVEFYDVRDASIALREMDGKSINGKSIVVQYSRPGGFSRKLFLASRFNHYFPPPPPLMLTHHHCRRKSPASQFRRKGSMKANTRRNQNQHYERVEKNNVNTNRTKNYLKKNLIDGYFVINEEAFAGEASGYRDGRTTVMIKNIPNKYSQKLLLEMLDTHCNDCNQKIIDEGNKAPMSSYDFVYLPIDLSNKCNVGYGFVNMTTPEAVFRLYKAFHNQHWGVFNSTKICEVTYARLQGMESIKEHFKKTRLPGVETEKYMPVLFSPPRDGLLMTEPIPIADLGTKPVEEDSCHYGEDRSVVSCSSDKTLEEGSDGEKLENGGVSDDESKTVV